MFDWVTGIIEKLGYVGVAALTFLENLFPPIPSELVIPLAGYVAAQGGMHVGVVIAVATLGSLGGTSAWYVLGRRIGERRVRAWVDRSGWWLTLTSSDLDRAQQWFERHGRTAVLIGRLVPGVRALVSLPAGFVRMPLAFFLIYSALGTAFWTTALAYAGVLLRSNFVVVEDWINVLTNILFAAFGVLMARRYVKCWWSRAARAA